MPEVCIELIERQGQRLWQVRFGRRTLTFQEELAARTFAAQLHMRLGWLGQAQRSDDSLP
ncbi:Uncharacterised protein [Ectopseudomonas mendocina]|jgi:hypothetical protein|uniref:Uncharacterized protein n=2 Tax=Ectopseudomonas mendocina TaxID=300 RepID=A0A379IVD3_ECTME|nr:MULTISPECIES: hypothetical protein [Pseudomonas]MBL0952106.1 hypothetical protein [Pseudomonas sp.]AEB58362.1 hypothetical protein MDS_2331 [Pseudomonas mendocina NK-01]ALN19423.1 hypothetical protein DW68_012545 [Pseudomonas mendocina S5.2]KER99697.1 hypothetical protein HN51_07595 [Pseudomonas mendocina]MDF2074668.1 hypothetical protein [Pseudomonas mendocina]